jgi:hypothetical protein
VDNQTNTLNVNTTKAVKVWDGNLTPAWTFEILSSFFAINGLTPVFYDCNNKWGVLNEDTGQWDGAVGMVVSLALFVRLNACASGSNLGGHY